MASELGAYYIQIIPSLQGAKRQIESQLSGVDTSSVGSELGKQLSSGMARDFSLASIGAKFTELGGQLDAVGTKLTNSITKPFLVGVAVAGGAAALIGKSALGAYATWEQAVGGVDTLFKDASGAVKQYADEAYKTAGLSANDYMGTVTSFSASLVNSLGGDTKAAAELANTAVMDMSDNANKMGSDMESIMQTYQSLARGNYAMLDNLKLGYGGTKTEMERLLADAEKLTGVHYDINNFSDVISAIHAVQDELGITGTTAKEAATTIEGSVASMKAAWTNWLTELGKDDADIPGLTKTLVDSFGNVLQNVVPRVKQIFTSMWASLPEIVDSVLAVLPAKFQALGELILKGNFTSQLREAFDWEEDSPIVGKILKIRDAIVGLFKIIAQGDFSGELRRAFNIEEDSPIVGFLLGIHDNIGKIIAVAVSAGPALKIFGAAFTFIGGAITNISKLVGWVKKIIPATGGAGGAVKSLSSVFGKLAGPIGLAITAIMALWSQSEVFRNALTEIGKAVWGLIQSVMGAVQPVIDLVMNALMPIVKQIGDLIGQVLAFLAPMITMVAQMITGIITAAMPVVEWIISMLIPIIQSILDVFQNVFNAIQPIVSAAMSAVQGIISTVMALIQGDWSGAWQGIKDFVVGLWNTIVETAKVIWNAFVDYVLGIPGRILSALSGLGNLWSKFSEWFGKAKDAAVEKFKELISWVGDVPGKILNALGDLGSLLWDAGKQIISGFLDGLKSKWGEVTDWEGGIGPWIADHKGPKAYDLGLLVPNGQWIMSGLNEGLERAFHDRVMGTVSGFGPMLAKELDAATAVQVNASAALAGGAARIAGSPADRRDSLAGKTLILKVGEKEITAVMDERVIEGIETFAGV